MATPLSPNSVAIALLDTGKVIGSQTNFMVNVDRRKLPVLALGRTEPLGYGRGFRIISGIIDYVILNQDLLLEINEGLENVGEIILADEEFEKWNPIENALYNDTDDSANKEYDVEGVKFRKMKPTTLDMLPPLDILVFGVDEDGQFSGMAIYGLEFTSSSLVATINDVALAQRAEWVAQRITPWTKVKNIETNG